MNKLLLILLVLPLSSQAKVITFPFTQGMQRSAQFSLKAEAKDVPAYDAPFASYACFDFEGETEVIVKSLFRDVKWVDIRPLSLGIKVKINNDSTFSFKLKKPCNISIEINGESKNFPLFLFTNAPETNIPRKNDPNVIFFEAGKIHKPNVIELKSHQTLYIEGGAVVEGLVFSKNAEHICVRGRGVLLGTRSREFSKEQRRMFSLYDCKNIELADILVIDSHSWDVAPFDCDNIYIHDMRIVSNNGGDDGMDINRCRNVRIEKCFIRTKDDCIAVKSFGKNDNARNTDNIHVSDCVLWNAAWGNAIELGFELQSDSVNNLTFKNCDVIHVEAGAVLSIHNADRAIVNNVLFEDIRVEDAAQKLVDLAIFITKYSSDGKGFDAKKYYWHGIWDNVWALSAKEKLTHTANRGRIQNITFRNINVIEGYFPFSVIVGWDELHNIENIVFENITVHGKKIQNLESLKLYNEFVKNISIR